MLSKEIRKQIKSRLEAAFQERLEGVLVFGSEARGEAGPDSDVDLMVLLQGPIRLGKDLEIIVDALYPLQLKLEAPIHAVPVARESFEAGSFALYRNAKREGVFL